MTHEPEPQGNQRHEDRGRAARGPETGSDGWDIRAFKKRTGLNVNSVLLALVLGGGTFGGVKLGGSVQETMSLHGRQLDDVAKAQAEAARSQSDIVRTHGEQAIKVDAALAAISNKTDMSIGLFNQVLQSQVKLEANQTTMGRAQDDLRVEIASLKSMGTEGKVRDLDAIVRTQGEKIAKLEAILEREREKK